ncbi:MAG: preprotein translocase subunit SecE [Clostridia bacterium]|nr:preprotein translocase subunit SecE [Clostridia bacterium]
MADVKKTDAPEKKPEAKKANKPSLGSRIGKWFREFKAEFKKIVWCNKRDTFNSTVLVVVSVIVVAAVVSGLDIGFSNAVNALGKLV